MHIFCHSCVLSSTAGATDSQQSQSSFTMTMNQVMNESIMQRKIEIADVTLLENLARMKIDGYSFNAAAKQAIDPKKLWRLKMIQTEFWKKMLTQL